MKKTVLISILSLSLLNFGFAGNDVARKISEGNELYNEGKYEEALLKYNNAQNNLPIKKEIFFNMGNVFYRQGKYNEAIDAFRKSIEKDDINLEAKALYNIGNSFFQQGRFNEALEAYKQSLERNNNDMDTKYNIEYTEKKIKEMLSKAEQTKQKALQEQNKRCHCQKGQKGDSEDSQVQSQEDKEKHGEVAQKKRKESIEEKKDMQENRSFEKNKNGDGEKRNARKKIVSGDKKDLTEEDAQRFLSNFEQSQNSYLLPIKQRFKKGRGSYVDKDW